MKWKLILIALAVLVVSGITGAVYLESKRSGVDSAADAAEKKFIQEMIPHHEGAIQMAKQADEQATTPEVKELAANIALAQQKEIDEMKGWYKQWWGTDVPKAPSDPHAGHGGEPEEAASTFDEGFINMMIPHHEAAIKMAEEVLPKARHQEIRDLANSIIRSQGAEIEQMKVILEKIKGRPTASGFTEVIYMDRGYAPSKKRAIQAT